jgi:hypothetical protein
MYMFVIGSVLSLILANCGCIDGRIRLDQAVEIRALCKMWNILVILQNLQRIFLFLNYLQSCVRFALRIRYVSTVGTLGKDSSVQINV